MEGHQDEPDVGESFADLLVCYLQGGDIVRPASPVDRAILRVLRLLLGSVDLIIEEVLQVLLELAKVVADGGHGGVNLIRGFL